MTVSFPDLTPDPSGRTPLRNRKYLLVHYTGIGVRFNDPAKEVENAREVCRYKRWEYNYLMGLGGGTFSQAGNYVGGHCLNFNLESVGVLLMNAIGVAPTQAQIASFHKLRKDLVAQGVLTADHEVHPHYGFRSTGCPGQLIAETPGAFKNSSLGDGRGRFGRVIPELRQPLLSTVPTTPTPAGPLPTFDPFVPEWGMFSLWPIAANKPTQRLGSHGDAVAYLQGVLKVKLGYGIIIDKNFGPQTDKAVRRFQTEKGLFVDGIVGRQTWRAIDQLAS